MMSSTNRSTNNRSRSPRRPRSNSGAATSANTATTSSTTTNNNNNNNNNNNSTTAATANAAKDTRPGAYAVTQTTSGPAQVLRVQVPNGVRPGSEFVVHPQNPRRRQVRVRCPITSGPGKTLQITIPPEPITERKHLTPAKLTAPPPLRPDCGAPPLPLKGGGAKPMAADVIQANEKRLEKYYELQLQLQQHHHYFKQPTKQEDEKSDENNNNSKQQSSQNETSTSKKEAENSPSKQDDAQPTANQQTNSNNYNSSTTPSSTNNNTATTTTNTPKQPKAFLVTIPPNIHPGMPFTIDVQGKRYVINCPPDAGPGKKVKIVPPRPRANSSAGEMTSSNTSNTSSTNNNASTVGNRSRANSVASTSVGTSNHSANNGDANRRRCDSTNSAALDEFMEDHSESSNNALDNSGSLNSNSANNNNNNNNAAPAPAPQAAKLQMFEVRVPAGVEPGQPFALMANGQRVLVTCPPNVQVGQKIRFNLPVTQQMVQNIQLQYDNAKGSASGWCRTIRVSDLKFQWVRVTGNSNSGKNTANAGGSVTDGTSTADPSSSVSSSTNSTNTAAEGGGSTSGEPRKLTIDQSRRLIDMKAMNDFHFSKSAYGRHLTLLKGNDARLRTGILSWVPAKDATVDSKLVLHQKVLLSYADIASIQQKPFADKLIWFEESLSKLLLIPWEDGHVKFYMRRQYLLQDSVDAVMSLSRTQLRQRWRLEFANEPAVDAGGVTREWFQLVTQQLFDANFGLWLPSANNQACSTINPVSDVSCPNDHLIYFRFLGRLMGRALLDRQLIHGHLVRSLYKHILGWPITFEDLAAQDEEYYNSLQALLDMDEDTLEALCLDFTVTEELFGARQVVELVPDGANIEVNKDNLVDYLEANLRYQMLERTRLQLTELLLGFFDVVPEPVLTVFDSHELELILCGLPTIDMDDWEANTKYAGRFKELGDKHKVVRWFWEIVRDDFDAEMKARLLQFVTGTSGVPSRGFSVLQGNDGSIKKFCLQGVDCSVHNYPRAHTCFNRLDLPQYSGKGELRSRLKTAITLSAVGFDMD